MVGIWKESASAVERYGNRLLRVARYLLLESYMTYAESILEDNQSSFSYNTFLSFHLSPVAMLAQLYDQRVGMPLSLPHQV
jgi:hypothetical protein